MHICVGLISTYMKVQKAHLPELITNLEEATPVLAQAHLYNIVHVFSHAKGRAIYRHVHVHVGD